jgi:cyclic lactone autoinducer peptide
MKQAILKTCTALSTLALLVTTTNVNAACVFNMHQPKLPAGAEKLSKIN